MKKILFQISSHWDREWYLTFQGFRYYLVDMVDGLLDALESKKIKEFVFDGQSIVIEDYLEIRPEKAQLVKRLISEGKIKIGPWYCMPDEFLVSGESIIENFLVGQNVSRAFGTEPWKFGYVNDIFGHIAQLPQILAGFSIDCAYLGRGVDTSISNDSHFVWRSPDGSECYTYKDNYGTFRRGFAQADFDEKIFDDKLAGESEDFPILLNFTDDHATIDEGVSIVLRLIDERGCEVLGGFEKLSDVMREHRTKLPLLCGELASPAYENNDFRTVTNSISSYYPIKKQNDIVENRLYRETAPLVVLGEMFGLASGKRAFFDTARRYLLKNQPHDSICGCSVDAVHDDMPYRYSQALAIADVIRFEIQKKAAEQIADGDTVTVQVFNTDIHVKNGILTFDIDFQKDWKSVFYDNTLYQKYNLFDIQDKDGKKLEYQILSIKENHELYKRQDTVIVDRYRVAVDTSLGSFGITEFKIVPKSRREEIPPKHPRGSLKAENEFIALNIDLNGQLQICDKQSGKVYNNIPHFSDEVDSGNGWFCGDVGFDSPTVSFFTATNVEVLCNGPLVSSFLIKKKMSVPASIDRAAFKRSEQYTELNITTKVILRQGEHHVEFETSIENNAGEHRLQMLIPTGISGDNYYTSQAFCFLERQRGVTYNGYNGRERELTEKNTGGIIGINKDIAFVSAYGLHEAGVYPDGTISVTMLRSIGKNFQEPDSTSARLIGKHEYKYAIAVSTDKSELYKLQQSLQNSHISNTVSGKSLPYVSDICIKDSRITASIIKPAENKKGWILRLFNPIQSHINTILSVGPRIRVFEADMAENLLSDMYLIGDIKLDFEPYKIKTLYLENKDD